MQLVEKHNISEKSYGDAIKQIYKLLGDNELKRQRERQTDRQTDRQTETKREKERETDRQTDREQQFFLQKTSGGSFCDNRINCDNQMWLILSKRNHIFKP